MKRISFSSLFIAGIVACCTFASAAERMVVCEMAYHDD